MGCRFKPFVEELPERSVEVINGGETFGPKAAEKKIALGSRKKHMNKTVFAVLKALKTLVVLATAGRLLGRKVFDHAAHLGGVTFRM